MYSAILYMILTIANPSVANALGERNVVVAFHTINMEKRYDNEFVNSVFKDNILLALRYTEGSVKTKNDIVWDNVRKPFRFELTLNPGEVFAFDDNLLPQYSNDVVKTTNARFISSEGFKYDGDLTGDGVCHLASLIYWSAKDAGLETYVPSDHNFAKINEIPKEYGVGILSSTPLGNLYIKNNYPRPVTFIYAYDGVNLTVAVVKNTLYTDTKTNGSQ